jgi:hypothetical protein
MRKSVVLCSILFCVFNLFLWFNNFYMDCIQPFCYKYSKIWHHPMHLTVLLCTLLMLDKILSGNGLLHSISGCFDKPNCLFGNKASYISIHGAWLCPLDSNLYWLLPKKNQETIQHPGKLTSDFPNKVCRKFACLLEPTSNAVACNVTTCYIILQLLT